MGNLIFMRLEMWLFRLTDFGGFLDQRFCLLFERTELSKLFEKIKKKEKSMISIYN